jgi:hypothetical protein
MSNFRGKREREREREKEKKRKRTLNLLTEFLPGFRLGTLLSVAKLNHPRLSPPYLDFLDPYLLDKIMHKVDSLIELPSEEKLKSMTDTEINKLSNKYKIYNNLRCLVVERNQLFLSKPGLREIFNDLYNKIKEGINEKLKIEIFKEDVVGGDQFKDELYESMKLKTGFEDAHESQLIAVWCVAPLEVNFDDPRFIIDLIDAFSRGWAALCNYILPNENLQCMRDIYKKLFTENPESLYLNVHAEWPRWNPALGIEEERCFNFIRNQTLKDALEKAIHPLLKTEELLEKESVYMEREARKYALRNPWWARMGFGGELSKSLASVYRNNPKYAQHHKRKLGVGGGLKQNRKTKKKNKSRKRSKTHKRKTKKRKSRRRKKRRS